MSLYYKHRVDPKVVNFVFAPNNRAYGFLQNNVLETSTSHNICTCCKNEKSHVVVSRIVFYAIR